MGVLSKVDSSSGSSPTVYIKKKSKEIRVCADISTGLNDAPKDYYYSLLEPEEEVLVQISGGRIFSKIDLSNAYQQIEVDDDCSKIR